MKHGYYVLSESPNTVTVHYPSGTALDIEGAKETAIEAMPITTTVGKIVMVGDSTVTFVKKND